MKKSLSACSWKFESASLSLQSIWKLRWVCAAPSSRLSGMQLIERLPAKQARELALKGGGTSTTFLSHPADKGSLAERQLPAGIGPKLPTMSFPTSHNHQDRRIRALQTLALCSPVESGSDFYFVLPVSLSRPDSERTTRGIQIEHESPLVAGVPSGNRVRLKQPPSGKSRLSQKPSSPAFCS